MPQKACYLYGPSWFLLAHCTGVIRPTLSSFGQFLASKADHSHPIRYVSSAKKKKKCHKAIIFLRKKLTECQYINNIARYNGMRITCGKLGTVKSLLLMTKASRSSPLSFLLAYITYNLL